MDVLGPMLSNDKITVAILFCFCALQEYEFTNAHNMRETSNPARSVASDCSTHNSTINPRGGTSTALLKAA